AGRAGCAAGAARAGPVVVVPPGTCPERPARGRRGPLLGLAAPPLRLPPGLTAGLSAPSATLSARHTCPISPIRPHLSGGVMSYPPNQNPYGQQPNNPYGQQPANPYAQPQQPQVPPQPGYGYPQPPAGQQPGYDQAQAQAQAGYGYPQQPPAPPAGYGYPQDPYGDGTAMVPNAYADWGSRIGATIVDGLIVGIVPGILYIIGIVMSAGNRTCTRDPNTFQETCTGSSGSAAGVVFI